MADNKPGPKKKVRGPTPLRGMPKPPGHMVPASKTHWYAIAALIDESGLLSNLDRYALEQLCCLYAKWLEAEKKVAELGHVIELKNGCFQKNPWYEIAVQCQRDMRVYLDKFGLTPAARAKLSAPEPETADAKWAEFDAG